LSDLFDLPLLFTAIYAVECARWVPEGDCLYLDWGGNARRRGAGLWFKNPWPAGFAFREPSWGGPLPARGPEDLRRAFDEFRRGTRALRWTCRLGFTAFFFFLAAYAFWPEAVRARTFSAATYALCHVVVSALLAQAHRRRWPERGGERWRYLVLCLISPWQSIRAMDLMWESFAQGRHPVALAGLLAPSEGRRFRRRLLRQLTFRPRKPVVEGVPASALEGTAADGLRRWLEHRDDPEPPPSVDSDAAASCPCCDASFTRLGGDCPDCGVPLVASGMELSGGRGKAKMT
jgi:hypothetical protein